MPCAILAAMNESDELERWPGRLITAGRGLAGLTVRGLADEAGVTTRTVVRVEAMDIVLVSPVHRHGAVSRDTWAKLVVALGHHGVQLTPGSASHGPGVRLKEPL